MVSFFGEIHKKFNIPFSEEFSFFKIISMANFALIEGHKGIITLADDEISLKLKKGKVSVFGENLYIKSLENDFCVISGEIKKIERA